MNGQKKNIQRLYNFFKKFKIQFLAGFQERQMSMFSFCFGQIILIMMPEDSVCLFFPGYIQGFQIF